jgi:hypothetical protein
LCVWLPAGGGSAKRNGPEAEAKEQRGARWF